MIFEKSRRCRQIDGDPDTFSGHARLCQNPVDLKDLVAVIPMSILTQEYPT